MAQSNMHRRTHKHASAIDKTNDDDDEIYAMLENIECKFNAIVKFDSTLKLWI